MGSVERAFLSHGLMEGGWVDGIIGLLPTCMSRVQKIHMFRVHEGVRTPPPLCHTPT